MNECDELRLSRLLQRFKELRLQSPPEQIFQALESIEREFPEALDRKAIGEWCVQTFFKQRGTRPLGHPREAYRQRLMEAARRLGHPLFLTVVMDQLSRQIASDDRDPIGLLDELLKSMPFPAERHSPAG